MPSLFLPQLLKTLHYKSLTGDATGVVLNAVTGDSRAVQPGTLFVAVAGDRFDGHAFIANAVERGAAAVIGSRAPHELDGALAVPYVQATDARHALAVAAAALHSHPSRDLTVIGVTGTDGKTTTCSILESIVNAATRSKAVGESGERGRAGVITTVGAHIRERSEETGLHVTTPDAPEIQRFLAAMRDAGCTVAIVESTSHGLAQQRVAAVDFDVAAVTNITHEHLDYHGSRDAYVAAKALLFRALFHAPAKHAPAKSGVPRTAVLNGDDEGSFGALKTVLREEQQRSEIDVVVRTYGLQPSFDVWASNIQVRPGHTRFRLHWWNGSFEIESPLLGEFNVYNVLCAAAATLSVGLSPVSVAAGVASHRGASGRMERIDRGQPFLALVDFAHSPASLERALLALRPLVGKDASGRAGRLIALFGSAGLRDRAKRGLMGAVSGRLADFTVITAEDPRTEDLDAINRAIADGVRQHASQNAFTIVPDRTQAIEFAVGVARAGDVVAAFGKGHERSMCFGEVEQPWNEQEVLAAALEAWMRKQGDVPLRSSHPSTLPRLNSSHGQR